MKASSSHAPTPLPVLDASTPEGHLAAAQAYQKENGGTLCAALSATAPKRGEEVIR